MGAWTPISVGNNSPAAKAYDSSKSWESIIGAKTKQAPTKDQLDQLRQQQAQQAAAQKAAQPQPAPKKSLLQNVVDAGKSFGEAAIVGTAKGAYDIASTIPKAVDIAKKQYGTPNATAKSPQAQQQIAQDKTDIKKNVGTALDFARFAPRAAIQVGTSVPVPVLNPHPSETSLVVSDKAPGLLKTVLGKQAIPSIQNTYKTTKQSSGTGTAVGTTAATILGDALAVKGGFDFTKKIDAAPNVIKTAAGKDPVVNQALKTAQQNALLSKARALPEHGPNSLPKAELDKMAAKTAADAQATPTAPQPGSVITPTAQAGQVAGAGLPLHPATEAVQKHMNDYYKPASDHPNEAFAAEHIKNNTSDALHQYEARTQDIYGSKNFVGGDDAKYSVPGMSPENSAHYHEPASQMAKAYYGHLLSDPLTKDKPVLITAGGTGAGKTSALKKSFNETGVDPNSYAAIVDTNLTTLSSATSRIEPALATGRPVAVQFVYRDPVEAYKNGVIPRATKEGRAVTAATHGDTHANSLDTIKQLADKYKDNDNVDIQIIDNSRGKGKSETVTLDFLHDKVYTKEQIEKQIHDLLDEQLQKGKITNEQHTTFKGTSDGVAKNGPDVQAVEPVTKPQAKQQPEQSSQERQVASTPKSTTLLAKTADKPKTLTASQTAHMDEISGYTHSSNLEQDYADMLRGQEQQAKGGDMVKRPDGTYYRVSEHSKFYREFYKENKKAPTKADYLEEAKRMLMSGKDEASADYKKLLEREAKPIPQMEVKSSPTGVGPVKVSKLGKGVEAKAVQAGLAKNLGDLPAYSKVNMKEQGRLAADLLANEEQKANNVALGREPAPHGLLPEAVFTAVETKALATGDVEMLRQLSRSSLVSEATAMGQRIRALAERNPESAVGNIQSITAARQKAFEAKSGKTVAKAESAEIQAIRAAKATIPKPTKETFASFVESLKC